jgi:hypothetical protein
MRHRWTIRVHAQAALRKVTKQSRSCSGLYRSSCAIGLYLIGPRSSGDRQVCADGRQQAPHPHPSRALWAQFTSDGKSILDSAGQEAMEICQRVPQDAARRLQSMLLSGAAHPWQQRKDGDTALHLAVLSGNEQVGKQGVVAQCFSMPKHVAKCISSSAWASYLSEGVETFTILCSLWAYFCILEHHAMPET